MKNNWVLKEDAGNDEIVREDFDDYGYGEDHEVSIGDEIGSSFRDRFHGGVVVGIIRNNTGDPVCYKVWGFDGLGFDYIQARDVTVCEPCGSAEWSLRRLGYELVQRQDCTTLVCERTGDVIRW